MSAPMKAMPIKSAVVWQCFNSGGWPLLFTTAYTKKDSLHLCKSHFGSGFHMMEKIGFECLKITIDTEIV